MALPKSAIPSNSREFSKPLIKSWQMACTYNTLIGCVGYRRTHEDTEEDLISIHVSGKLFDRA
jgi:hypothetical protein